MELKEIYKPIERDLAEVKAEMRRQLGEEDSFMNRIIEDIVESSGKLFRPALALLAFWAGGDNRKNKDSIIKTASVIELIHTATLIHDDVIDETALRRHRPNLHTRWGDKISVLFGDFLFSRSFRVLSQLGFPEIVCALANTVNLICEGELKQINRAYDWGLSAEDYFSIIEKKTASLFSFSCFSGGCMGGAGANEIEALVNYGINLGIAFQIVDDCLDFVGDEKVTGKSLGSDLRKGKVTLPLIYLLSSTPREVRKKIIEFISSERDDVVATTVKGMIKEYQIMYGCAGKIVEYIEKAKKEITRINNTGVRKSFTEICDYTLANSTETFSRANKL